uniref:Translocation protein SEC62 n=1 Tax=Anas zonorhyncha TaxID=75864 RepID=A0A8B9VY42_9AVES
MQLLHLIVCIHGTLVWVPYRNHVEVGEPFKEEKAVAKYLRFNCPTKSTNMMGHRVDYFIASKAVDCLLDSKWAKAKKGEEALFTTRESVVEYCNRYDLI